MNARSVIWGIVGLVWLSGVLGPATAFGWADQGTAGSAPAGRADSRPNILLLLADDQRCDTISAYGNPAIQTPNLDRLARSGVNFRQAYCFGSPHGAVCVPSRAMLHSGRTLFRLPDLNLQGSRTLGECLGGAGYQTFATGKWHNGRESFARSFQRGRNVFLGGMSDHSQVPLVQLQEEAKFSAAEIGAHFSSRLFADAAIEFLGERDPERPFFCYVAFTAPHDPRMSPGNFNRMYRPQDMPLPPNFLPQHPFDSGDLTVRDENLLPWPRTPELVREQLSEYYGLVSHLDQQVGRIVAAVQEQGLDQNTIIVYAADHGLALGSHGLLGKQSLYEHSMRAPLIVVGPGIAAGDRQSLVYLHDLFPTILEWADVPLPAENEGRSLRPWLSAAGAEAANGGREVLFTAYKDTIRAVRDERWKLIRYPQIDRTQLFDLVADPHETQDLSTAETPESHAALERLSKLLVSAQAEHGDRLPWVVAEPKPAEIDLTGHPRKPDQWQPKWIVEKYFSQE
jgi:arylsulfatase A-like enzyme